jgi:hypothetical protein
MSMSMDQDDYGYDDDGEHQDGHEDGHQPDQAADLEEVRAELARLTAGHKVLELGCGHGDPASALVPGATCALAIQPFDLPASLGGFDTVVMAFTWSRLKRDEQETFIKQLRARVGKDVLLILVDDDYVEGSSPTVARTDAQGNTYHMVTGADGKQVEMPKTYPTDSALRKRMASTVREIKIQRWEFYWLLTCRLK